MKLLPALSDPHWILTGSFVALVLVSIASVAQYRIRKRPHGPSQLSVFLSVMFPEKLFKYKDLWKRQFGNVYTSFVGRLRYVVMTDYDVIHDALVRQADDCSSRPTGVGAALSGTKDKGLILSPQWKEQRRFALTVLHDQGMGKIEIEHKIIEEISPFLKVLDGCCGTPTFADSYIYRAVSNVICNLVLGHRFEYEDSVFKSLLEKFLKQTALIRKMGILNQMPLLKMLPGDPFGYHRYMADGRANIDFFLKAIRQHEETLDVDSPRDFIDSYLIEMKERSLSGSPSSFDDANCVASVVQLFVAGTDTTSNTLLWAWLYMILHPDIQKRVQREIDGCMGSRAPSLKDRARMPFTEAVLTEVMRLANTVISSIPHKTDADVSIGGLAVPRDTTLIASLSDVHLDEANYPDPHQFIPQRFLSSSGAFEKPKKFIPFGIGRRACVGESLARAELFLFFTSVLQHFELSPPEGCIVKVEGKPGFIHKPAPYKLVFQRRHPLS